MDLIKKQWESFSTEVIDTGAPDIQRSEMCIAFYAGVQAMLTVLKVTSADTVSEDQAVAILSSCQQEVVQFAEQLSSGTQKPQP